MRKKESKKNERPVFSLKTFFEKDMAQYKRCFGVVGHPLGHTLSPVMHNEAMVRLGMPAVYRAIPVPPEDWPAFVKQARGILHGFNVTVPYKEKMWEACRKNRECPNKNFAHECGAVNTMVRHASGWEGSNTDGIGFVEDLAANNIEVKGRNVVLLGAGGAARALLLALKVFGCGPKKVAVFDTLAARPRKLKRDFLKVKTGVSFDVEAIIHPGAVREALKDAALLINATPLGLKKGDPLPVPARALHKDLTLYDLIYHRETELMTAVKAAGGRAVGGLGMLVRQGAKSFELWFHHKPSIDVMMAAAEKEIIRRSQS